MQFCQTCFVETFVALKLQFLNLVSKLVISARLIAAKSQVFPTCLNLVARDLSENVQRYRAEIMADVLHVQYEVAVSGEENWSLFRQTLHQKSLV